MTFEEKVRSMTAKQLIITMLDAIEDESTNVVLDFETYGNLGADGLCYGCAATRAICRLGGRVDENSIKELRSTTKYHIEEDEQYFVVRLEDMFNELRQGLPETANRSLLNLNMGSLQKFDASLCELPSFNNYNWREIMPIWREYANNLPD